jgi:hypothetical protein
LRTGKVTQSPRKTERQRRTDAAFLYFQAENLVPTTSKLFATEGVADGSTNTKNVVGVEVGGVIYDAIEMSFGADKEAPPHGVADVGAEVEEKVIAVKMGVATCREIAIAEWAIEKYALATNARHEVGVHPLA